MLDQFPGSRVRTAVLFAAGLVCMSCGGSGLVLDSTSDETEVISQGYESFLRAQLLAELRYWEEAAHELRVAISYDPQAPALHLELADTLRYVDGALDEGLMACDLASDLGAAASDVALTRVRLWVDHSEPTRALDFLRELPADAARSDVFVTWLSLEREQHGDVEAAARAYTTVLPDEPGAWRALGDALRESDPVAAAEAFGQALLRPDPDAFDAYERVALFAQAEAWDDAIEAAAECREQFWEYWPCSSWQAYLMDRDTPADDPVGAHAREALAHLAFMVSADPRQLARSGAELRLRARDELVREYVRIVASTRPFNVSVVTGAAWIANGIEDYPLAIEMMERVLAIDDASFDALNYIGYSWAEMGENLDQAEVYIREALFLRGPNGHMLDSLAWVLFRRGELEEALAIQLEAIELLDDNAVLWDHLGDIYLELGNTDDALEAWTRALDYADEYSEDVLEDAPRKIEGHRGSS